MKRDTTGEFVRNWDSETKQRVSMTLTATAWRLLDEEAQKQGISRSEVIEQVARSFGNDRQQAASQHNGKIAEESVAQETAYCVKFALQEAPPQVATVLESISDAFVAFDRDWRYTYVNRAAAQLLKKTPEELIGKHVWKEVFPSLVGELAYRELHRAVAEQVPVAWEEWGEPIQRWLEVNAYPSTSGVAVYFRDITERKLAEVALKESEEKLRLFIEQAPVSVAMFDQTMHYITASQRWVDHYQLGSIEAVIGRSHYDLFPNLPDYWKQVHQRCLAGASEKKDEDMFLLPDGRENYLRWEVQPWYASTGNIGGIVIFSEDISDRKLAEVTLRNSAERLSVALAAAKLGDWSWDAATDILTFSERAAEIFGIPSGPYMTWTQMQSLLHEEDRTRARKQVEIAIAEASDYDIEYRVMHPQGTERWVAAKGRAQYDPSGQVLGMLGVVQDITERKLAEEALRASESRFQVLVSNVPGMVYRYFPGADGSDAFSYVSSVSRELFELEPETLLQDASSLWRLIHPDDFPSLQESVAIGVKNTLSWQWEGRVITPSGQLKWIQGRSRPQETLYGIAWDGLLIDISDRKQAEAALAAQEQRYRYIFEAVSISIWEEDFSEVKAAIDQLKAAGVRDFRQYFAQHPEFVQWAAGMVQLRDVNQASLRMFGAQNKAELLTSLHQIFVPETQEAFIGELLAIAAEEPFFAAETVLQTLLGDRIDVWFTIAFPSNLEGYDRVLVSLVDISEQQAALRERKRAEVALRESESRFRNIADQSPIVIWMSAPDGAGIWFNQQWCEFTGQTLEEALGSGWLAALHPEDAKSIEATCLQAHQRHEPVRLEYRLRRQDGEYRWVFDCAVPRFDGAGAYLGYIGSIIDIDDRKQAEAEREQLLARELAAREEAERANRIKDEFLAVLSHELRSPLNPILGWAKLLQSRTFDEQKTKQALETIERNAKLQAQLVEDLLDVSRILRGKLVLNKARLNLLSTIEAALETVRLAAVAKEIQIQTVFDPNVGHILGDSARLQQVIWNLLSNAVKFTPSGGTVEIRLEQIGTHAEIQVKDNGIGIKPEFLPYVFEYFRQEDGTTTRKFGGLGLGLAIVRHLVELHGGTVWAESPGEGLGATFTVRLPLMPVLTATPQDNPQAATIVDLSELQILIVDDRPDIRDIVAFILEEAKAKVRVAASAAEALKLMEQSLFDVLICDIGMPDIDGYMLMRQIRTLPPERGGQVPAIALSAYAGEVDRQQALAAGFQRHLAKPVEPDKLVEAIKILVELTPC